MNLKKYRVCLALLIAAVVAGSIFYYSWYIKNKETPVDGMLVQNFEIENMEIEVEEAA